LRLGSQTPFGEWVVGLLPNVLVGMERCSFVPSIRACAVGHAPRLVLHKHRDHASWRRFYHEETGVKQPARTISLRRVFTNFVAGRRGVDIAPTGTRYCTRYILAHTRVQVGRFAFHGCERDFVCEQLLACEQFGRSPENVPVTFPFLVTQANERARHEAV